jgi:serine/threonine-protein kinase
LNNGGEQHVIAGKYQLLKQLGRGAMGSVWQARHLTLRSAVAIKLMDPAIGLSSTGVQRFLREARAAAGLRSPHVVQILDHGVDQGTPYIVMEMLEGESLAARLERVRRLSPAETARIVSHVARALSRAERAGIVHRDLKPDNVFLVGNEDEELAKVLDFGIAKVHGDGGFEQSREESTAAGALLGTPYYVSPEQAEGLKSVDHRTDIWSLGVMTYECLLGRRPFDGDTLPALLLAICSGKPPVPSAHGFVPHGFDAWFARACAHAPQSRFASAKEAANQLLVLCGGRASTPSITPPPRGGPLDVPKLKLGNDDDGDEEEEAPTEIWRGGAVEQALEGAGVLAELPVASPPATPLKPPAPGPREVPVRAESITADSKNGFSRTARRATRSGGMGVRIAALAGLAVVGSGIGLWLGSQQTTVAQLPLSPAPRAASSSATAAPSASARPADSAASELPPMVDLQQLPVAQTARAGKPAAGAAPADPSTPAKPAAPAAKASSRPDRPGGDAEADGDTLRSNPYR